MARASIKTCMGIAAAMALGVASVEASHLHTAGVAGLFGQFRSSRGVDITLNAGIDAYRRGDYDRATAEFQKALKGQDYLTPDKRQELRKYMDLNNEALRAQRAGADQLKQADDLLKAGKSQEAEAVVKKVMGNQFLTPADKQKAQQLSQRFRPNSGVRQDSNATPSTEIARARLKQGREQLSRGNFEAAAALANETLKLSVAYDPGEDRPDMLLTDVKKYRGDEKWLLQASRDCLKRGELEPAEKLARLAEQQGGWRINPFADSPRKVLADIQAAKIRMAQQPPAPPGAVTSPPAARDPIRNAYKANPPAGEPDKVQATDKNQSRMNPAVTNNSNKSEVSQMALVAKDASSAKLVTASPADNEKAHTLVKEARAALDTGDLTKAQQLVTQASALRGSFNWWEDTPEKVVSDLQRASSQVKATPPSVQPVVVETVKGAAATEAQLKDLDAKDLTRLARAELNIGHFDEAEKAVCQAKTKAGRVSWGLFEDSPDKVQMDIRKARTKHEREESAHVLAEARKLFNEGKYSEAKAKAYRADRLHGPYSMLELGDRPQKLIAEINAAETRTQHVQLPPPPPAPVKPASEAVQTASHATTSMPATDTKAPAVAAPVVAQNNTPAGWPRVTAPPQQPAMPVAPANAQTADLAKQWATQCLLEARKFQAEGKLVEARQKALEGDRLHANFSPHEDRPELALTQLQGQAAKRIADLVQEATDLTNTAGNDPNRLRKAEEDLVQARQLAAAFAQDPQQIDLKLAWVRQTRTQVQTVGGPPLGGALPVTMAQHQETTPVTPNSPQAHGQEMLKAATLELQHGNTANARRLAMEVYQGNYGMQPQAVTVLRSIDIEEFNQRRLAARHAFEAGVKAFYAKDFVQARSILRSVDHAVLDPKDLARYNEVMRTPEMQPQQTLVQVGALNLPAPNSATPPTAAPGRAVATDQQALPAPPNREAPFGERVSALQEIEFQKLRDQGLQAQREASERFRAGDGDRALEILTSYLSTLGNTQLDAGRVAMLRRPVESRLEQFKSLKTAEDFKKGQAEKHESANAMLERKSRAETMKHEKVAELMKQFNSLYGQAKYEEAQMVAMKAHELDPGNPIVDTAMAVAKNAYNKADYNQRKGQREDVFLRGLNEAETEGPYVGMNNPLAINQEVLDKARKRTMWANGLEIMAPRGEKEREIERSLSTPVTIEFKNTPLEKVIDELRGMTSINIVADRPAMEEQSITLDRPITITLDKISLKSALNLLLHQVHLTYVIRDEALQITTPEKAKGKLVQKTYSVADLVIPVDNHTIPAAMNINSVMDKLQKNASPGGTMYSSPTIPNGNPVGTAGGAVPGVAPNMPAGNTMTSTPATGTKIHGPGQTTEDILIQTILNTVSPQSWSAVGGAGTVDYFPLGMALVINQTPDIQEQVAELLAALRRLQDIEVAVEVRIISLNESFYERIGVDFNMNIVNHNTKYQAQILQSQFAPQGLVQSFTPPSQIIGLTPAGTFTHDLNIPITVSSFGPAVPPFNAVAPGADGGIAMGLAFLSDIQVFMFLDAAQGNLRTNVMQAPKLTMFNGQTATINVQDQQFFVVGTTIGILPVSGAPTYSVTNFPVPAGTFLTMQPVVSADRRFVRISLSPTLSTTSSDVPLFPYSTVITPFYDITPGFFNSNPQPLVITQYLQQPKTSTVSVQTTVNIPDGGTVLLGGLKTMREGRNEFGPPILSKIPWVNRLFKNTAYEKDTTSLMIMVTPRIIINEEEETVQTGYVAPPQGTQF